MFQSAGSQKKNFITPLHSLLSAQWVKVWLITYLLLPSTWHVQKLIVSTLKMICPTSSVVFGIFIVVAKKYEHLKPVANFFNGVKVRKVDHETWGGYVCWSQEKTVTILSKTKWEIWFPHEKDKEELKRREKRSMKISREFQATEV